MITEEEISRKCLLPRIDYIDLIKKYGYDEENNRYIPVVINAPTGCGKTLRMLEFVVNPSTSGVIFVHSIEASNIIISKLKELFDYDKTDVVEYNSSNQPDYAQLSRDPYLFDKYRWIICYAERLFSGQLKYYTSYSELDLNLYQSLSMASSTKYVFVDECLSKPIEINYTASDISEFLNIIRASIDGYGNIMDLVNNPKDSEDIVKSKWKVFCRYLESLNESDISNYHYSAMIRILLRDRWTSKDYDRKILIDIIKARGFNFIKNLFRNLNEAKECMLGIKNNGIWTARLGIQDLPDKYPIIAFDATADINYKDSAFKIVTLKDLVDGGWNETSGLVNINVLPYNYLGREYNKYDILRSWKDNLPEFKDNSIILWTMDAGKNDNIDTESIVNERIKELGVSNCHFIYYGSSNIKGTNEFSSCKNIYILSEFFVNKVHVLEHRDSTGSTSYTSKDKCIGDIIQLIGRSHIRLTRIKTKDTIDENDKVNVYLVNNIDPYVIDKVKYYTKGIYNFKDESTLRWYINNFVKDQYGYRIKSNLVDKLIEVYYSNCDKKLIDQLCNRKIDRINNFYYLINQLNLRL